MKFSKQEDHSIIVETNNKHEDLYMTLKIGLEMAVYEAQLLLDYAAKQGLKIEENSVKSIIHLKVLLQEGQWTSEDEINFWVAFSSLAEMVKPVTIASLKASTEQYSNKSRGPLTRKGQNVSPASRAVRRYRNWTVYTLVVLLIIQIYWLVGSKVIIDLEELPKKISNNALEIVKLRGLMQKSNPTEDGDNEINDYLSQITRLELEIKNYQNQAETSDAILSKWNKFWQTLLNPMRLVTFAQVNQASPSLIGKIADQTSAEFVIQILQFYLLPLLYGLLGACTYVLRVLSHEIHRLTYSTDSDIRYRLRLYLGVLSGLVVAWFFSGEGIAFGLESFPPLALAFFAGYSVEVIFAIMDKFISNFSSDAFQPQGTQSK